MENGQILVQNGSFSAPVSILKEGNGLSPTQRLILLALHSFTNPQKATASPSHNEIVKATGFTRKCVITNIEKMITEGWIKKTKRFTMSPEGKPMNDNNSYILINKGSVPGTLGSEPSTLGGSVRGTQQDMILKENLKRMIEEEEDDVIINKIYNLLLKPFPHVTEAFIIEKWNYALSINTYSFESYLASTLIKELKKAKPKTRTTKKKRTRVEIVPDWLEGQEPEKPQPDLTPEEAEILRRKIDEDRKELEKSLQMFKNKRKKA